MWPSPSHLFPTGLVKIEPYGLDDSGTSHYSIFFDKTKVIHGFQYKIKSVQPSSLTYKTSSIDFRIQVSHAASLEWNDAITVTVAASSTCLNGYEMGHSSYILNIASYVQLFHKYNDELSPTNETVWTTDGWRSRSHITLYPFSTEKYVIGREYVTGPCPGAWIQSELHILNSSQYTFWNPTTQTTDSSYKFIGPSGVQRCHREELGSVCVVRARTRLTWPTACLHTASIWQSVSQIARMTPHTHNSVYPSDFDTTRRAPVPDQQDLRYDVCTAVLCSSSEKCSSIQSENTDLAADGDIFIHQHHTITNTWIEIQCEFEVVGFLDNIWSPHIYMRKWYGYEWY